MVNVSKKNFIQWFIFICLFVLLGYILINPIWFSVDYDTEEIIYPPTKEYHEDYTEYTGEFVSKQNRIKKIKLPFEDGSKVEEIQIQIYNEKGKSIANYKLGKEDIKKKKAVLFPDQDQWLKKNATYKLEVRIYSAEEINLSEIRVKYNTFMKAEYIFALGIGIAGIILSFWDLVRKSRKKRARKRILKKEIGIY
ncbi:MAG: hypothetical protein Q4B70_17420 [Lachnospiraceae bacterium]|nr:hypothetical protein [Lachnospiraceae bacterium]